MIQKRDLYSVYTHTSPTGKVYVGVSNNPKRRWGTYGAPYLYKNKYGNFFQSCFANAIIKYGWDNFNHEILLEKVSFSEALYAEKYLIKWYKTHNMSYNMSDGGECCSGSRKPLSEKRRLEVKEFMNTHHPMKGRHHTEEAKAKMSEAAKNRNFTKEQKAIIAEKISKANKGKHKILSEDSRRKLILRNKEMYKKGIIKPKGKEVHQYDFDGIYITSYASVSEAPRTDADGYKKERNPFGNLSFCPYSIPSGVGEGLGIIISLSLGNALRKSNSREAVDNTRYF